MLPIYNKKDIIYFLFDPGIELPIDNKNKSFAVKVSDYKNNMLNLLENVEDPILDNRKKELSSKVEYNFKKIEEVFDLTLKGKPSSAFKTFDEMMQRDNAYLKLLSNNPKNPLKEKSFYRIRILDNPLQEWKTHDLFHIPFDLRHNVKRQRFSLPGVPCLYLGGSMYVSWLEMNKPDFDKIVYSKFKTVQDVLKVFDLGYRPALMAVFAEAHKNDIESYKEFLYDYIEWLPLRMACSHIKRYNDAPFIEEYIIPQMLLTWIIENGDKNIDGIRYHSCRVNHYELKDPHLVCNYVFPPKQIKNEGICNVLNANWTMTSPAPYQIIKASSPPFSVRIPIRQETIELVDGLKWEYHNTVFGDMEDRINDYPLNHCRRNLGICL